MSLLVDLVRRLSVTKNVAYLRCGTADLLLAVGLILQFTTYSAHGRPTKKEQVLAVSTWPRKKSRSSNGRILVICLKRCINGSGPVKPFFLILWLRCSLVMILSNDSDYFYLGRCSSHHVFDWASDKKLDRSKHCYATRVMSRIQAEFPSLTELSAPTAKAINCLRTSRRSS